jgi:NADPH2:quinone reductase
MKAYLASEQGATLQTVEAPRPGPKQVLVRVRACALNRVDLAMARGYVHGGAGGVGNVLGVEWAGEVVDAGAQVEGLRAGERVMGSGAGAFAEYTLADSGRVLPIPAGFPFERAAALPVALQTMHDAVITHGALQPGQAVLIQGASSGVGLMGLRIARQRGARMVIGSSGDPARRARLLEFGADLAIDHRASDWVRQVLDATAGQGVDLVVDQIAGPLLNDNLRATRIAGRVVNVGRLGGNRAELDCDLHALRRISYIGVTFRTRSGAEVREIVERMRQDLWQDLAADKLDLPIDRVFAFEELPAALEHMRANRHFGKVIVRV